MQAGKEKKQKENRQEVQTQTLHFCSNNYQGNPAITGKNVISTTWSSLTFFLLFH